MIAGSSPAASAFLKVYLIGEEMTNRRKLLGKIQRSINETQKSLDNLKSLFDEIKDIPELQRVAPKEVKSWEKENYPYRD